MLSKIRGIVGAIRAPILQKPKEVRLYLETQCKWAFSSRCTTRSDTIAISRKPKPERKIATAVRDGVFNRHTISSLGVFGRRDSNLLFCLPVSKRVSRSQSGPGRSQRWNQPPQR